MGVTLFLVLFGMLTLIDWDQVTQKVSQNLPSASSPALCAYITNNVGNIVSVINASTNNIAIARVGSSPVRVEANPDGTKVYVANYNSKNVSINLLIKFH